MAAVDWWVIVFYLTAIIIAGLYFTRRANKGLNEYFLTNRSLPWWIAGTSMVATSFSCDTPLYVTKLVRTGGIYLNWQWWSFLIGGMLSAFLLAKLWRRAEVLTDVELTELRYGGLGAKILRGFRAVYFAVPINGIAMGWVLLAMAKIAAAMFGWDKWFSILVFSFAALSYSMMAGFWGVVVTDLAQFILAMIGASALAFFAVDAAGGMQAVLDFIASQPERYPDTIRIVPTFKSETGRWLTPAAIGFLTYNLVQWWANINSDGGGKVIQRINACKNENHALGAVLWYNFAHFVLRSWPWIIAALASIKLYPYLDDPEMAYPKMMMELLPAGVKGLVAASLVAAFLSTHHTPVDWGGSFFVNDFFKTFIKPHRSPKHFLLTAQAAGAFFLKNPRLAGYLPAHGGG
ncbi:MAG: sodium:proline symporter, partial [FCB group bacterium]|nr:sodium:proline symporter [FCB group bacterium]